MRLRQVLLAKLHGGSITQCDVHYEGSCGLGVDLLEASGIAPFEKVSVLNVSTGARLETYAIRAETHGEISLNGAAARSAAPGDKVIILAYVAVDEQEMAKHKARIIILDPANKIRSSRTESPVL